MPKTAIQWADHSINPIRYRLTATAIEQEAGVPAIREGHHCRKIDPACANCYASTLQPVFFKMPGFDEVEAREGGETYLSEKALRAPLHRRKPTVYFWCSMTDMFGSWVPDAYITECFKVMQQTPQHRHVVLTKRPGRAAEWMAKEYHAAYGAATNIHFGVSVGNQESADKLLPQLVAMPWANRIVSYEPAIGRIDFTPWLEHLAQIIVGGESGSTVRPCDLSWLEQTVHQCLNNRVPVFVKQLGTRPLVPKGLHLPPNFKLTPMNDCADWLELAHEKGGDMAEWPLSLQYRQQVGHYENE